MSRRGVTLGSFRKIREGSMVLLVAGLVEEGIMVVRISRCRLGTPAHEICDLIPTLDYAKTIV